MVCSKTGDGVEQMAGLCRDVFEMEQQRLTGP
jgi:hypothetical protein